MPTKKTTRKTTKRSTAKKTTAKKTKSSSERQTHARTDVYSDSKRKAKLPGRRVSANGNVYYERRDNRSDTSLERTAFETAEKKAKAAAARKKRADQKRRSQVHENTMRHYYRY